MDSILWDWKTADSGWVGPGLGGAGSPVCCTCAPSLASGLWTHSEQQESRTFDLWVPPTHPSLLAKSLTRWNKPLSVALTGARGYFHVLNDLPWGQHNNIEQNKTKILIAGTGSLEASHQTDFRERQPRRAKWRPGLLPEASDFPAKFGEKSDRGRVVANVIISSVFQRLKNQPEFGQQRAGLEMGSAFSEDLRLKEVGIPVFLPRSRGCFQSTGT